MEACCTCSCAGFGGHSLIQSGTSSSVLYVIEVDAEAASEGRPALPELASARAVIDMYRYGCGLRKHGSTLQMSIINVTKRDTDTRVLILRNNTHTGSQ